MPPVPSHTARPRLLYVVVEDWFFVSHFISFARAAVAAGFDVAVATRTADHGALIEETGARLIPLASRRSARGPLAMTQDSAELARLFRTEAPDIVHLIGLKPIVAGSLAARMAGVKRRVIALTGLGFIGAGTGPKAAAARTIIRRAIAPLAGGMGSRFVFENRTDPAAFGLSPDAANVTILGGAGVDPERYPAHPLPPMPPLRLAMVSRMLWSKGADLAVEAVQAARARGANVELSLVGAPDTDNPRALSEATLRQWASLPGISWPGRSNDIASVWAAHHVAIQPSRGGEGLPRTVLEAASCGRAILTTDVPGCRDFVRNGIEGRIVAPGDVKALTDAILALAADPAQVAAMGIAARARLLDGFTEAAVTGAVVTLYRAMLR